MKIVYLNKGKAKKKAEITEILERAYLRDMAKVWRKRKAELMELGFTEIEFIKRMKDKMREEHGLYM